ncbi:MAG: hypothetical protein ACXWJK_17150 [Burkholderiaceae bacterium]
MVRKQSIRKYVELEWAIVRWNAEGEDAPGPTHSDLQSSALTDAYCHCGCGSLQLGGSLVWTLDEYVH